MATKLLDSTTEYERRHWQNFSNCCGAQFLECPVTSYELRACSGIVLSFHPVAPTNNWQVDVVETRNGPITIGALLGDS